jgi:hypothetical protein
MVQELPRRTASSGPALIRLLARMTGTDVFESRHALPDRLSQWLGWTDAIALAGVLNSPAATVPSAARSADAAWEDDYARVRASLEKAMGGDTSSKSPRQRGRPAPIMQGLAQAVAEPAFSTYRQRYGAFQQTLETSIAALRGRVRTALAARGPEMARLAGLDAAMEQALGEREMLLLAGVPTLLEAYFERLKQAATPEGEPPAPAVASAGESSTPAAADAWLDVFHKNLQSVMLAELDIRLQPVEGLLKALRAG